VEGETVSDTLTPETLARLRELLAIPMRETIRDVPRNAAHFFEVAVNALPALLAVAERLTEVEAERDRLRARVAELETVGNLKYRCGCPALRVDKVQAFCPVHLRGFDSEEKP
jgi:hypothetical protein